MAQRVDPTTLDPMNHQETPAANLARNMFDTLLERDENLVIQPALAVALPRLVAPTAWEFKLRPGEKFHNGEPLDAAAVKFSLERLVDPKLKLRGATPFAPISHVEVVDVDEVIRSVLDGRGIRVAIMLTDRHFGIHEWGSFLNNMAYVHKAGPVWLIGWGTATYDAEIVYVPLFRSGKILANYYNADFDGMVDQAQTTMDAKKRLEAYLRINRLWVDDAAGMPLYQQLDLYGATKRMAWKARGDEAIKGFEMAVR